MNYVGVDIRKKYSVLCAVDELGKKVREGRVAGNSEKGFARFFAQKHDQCFSLLQLFSFSGFPFASFQLPGADSSIQRINVHHSITGSIILAS